MGIRLPTLESAHSRYRQEISDISFQLLAISGLSKDPTL